MTTEVMKNIKLVNNDVLSILNKAVDLWRSDPLFRDSVVFDGENAKRDDWISDEYFDKIVNMKDKHAGFPEKSHMASLRPDFFKTRKADPAYKKRYIDGWKKINEDLMLTLGVKNNALCAVYPPGGFIGWHNNANASAYNLIMTWSETGNGYWKHFNPYTKEVETIPDVAGWQAKATFFGGYRDKPEDVVYHMASTDCWRMTIAYIFDRSHKQYWEDALAELEMP